jgi:HSP20 family protein
MIMSDIQVKKNGPQQPSASASAAMGPAQAWEPSRWLTRMMGWDPFREMAPFFPEERATLAPAFEVKETKDGYHFKADVPGMKESDLDVSMTGNRLTITGKREAEKENKGDTFYTYERTYGSFTRAFTLPDGIDANTMHASLQDGVLSIIVPKKPESQAKKIPVSTETKKA